MKDRILKIRKDNKMSQDAFANRLKLSRNFIGLVEGGERNLSERTIEDICQVFNVNREWLVNGIGEPYKERTRTQEIGIFINKVMSETDDNFKKRFIVALSKLDESEWEALANIAEKLLKEG